MPGSSRRLSTSSRFVVPDAAATGVALGFIDAEIQGEPLAATVAFAKGLVRDGAGVRRTSERGVDPATATAAQGERPQTAVQSPALIVRPVSPEPSA